MPQMDPDQVYGRRSLDQVIQSRTLTSPERVFAQVACSEEPLEIKDVTYSHLSNAISQAAWLIQGCIGKNVPQDQPLWYTGTSDLRHLVFVLAACRVGHTTLFISPKNTPDAHLRLLRATSCRHVFTSSRTAALSELATSAHLDVHDFPSLDAIMWSGETTPFVYGPSFDEIVDRPCMVLHTSGSTNYPKPVTYTHMNIAAIDQFHNLPAVNGEQAVHLEHHPRNNLFLGYPLFHAAGLNQIMYCIFFETISVFGPASAPLSTSLLETMLDTDTLNSAALPPAIIEEAAQDSNLVKKLSRLDYVVTSGAPLTEQVGDQLCNVTRLIDLVGSTECNSLPELRLSKSPEDWTYHHFHPSLGIEFRHHLDDTYEAVFVRSEEYEQFQAAFVTFPDETEYATSDLYSPHPTRSGLWRYRGRKDNLIVLSNGEKLQPDETEAILCQQEEIETALLAGQGRFQPAAVLIPKKDQESSLDADRVQSLLQLANEHLPAHAQLASSHLRILQTDTTLSRSLKGKLQRDKATNALKPEIDSLYRQAEASSETAQLDLDDPLSLEGSIHNMLRNIDPKFQHISPEDNLFSHGADSLTVTRLWRFLEGPVRRSSKSDCRNLSSRLVYENPSIRQLTIVLSCLNQGKSIERDSSLDIEEMRTAISTAATSLPSTTVQLSEKSKGLRTVVVTGTTGSLGCYVLDSLMRNMDGFEAIHCFNRSADSALRQKATHLEKGLRCDFSQRNVNFHTVDLSQDKFGLAQGDDETYNTLLSKVDCVIHLAWSVNWSEPLTSFASQLKGCGNLIEFSCASAKRPRIIFASSVGVANNLSGSSRVVSEAALDQLEATDPTGYARSKLVAEHILHQASCSPLDVPITVCRIGQIAGSTSGRDWSNTQEWFPSLIAASATIGMLPQSLGSMDQVDWIPVNVVAEALTELASDDGMNHLDKSTLMRSAPNGLGKEDNGPAPAQVTYAHLVNPNRTAWSGQLLQSAMHAMGSDVRIVSLGDWVSTLEARIREDCSLEESSAGRLLDFYKDLSQRSEPLPVFETSKTRQLCPSIDSLPAVQPSWLRGWIADWAGAGSSDISTAASSSDDTKD